MWLFITFVYLQRVIISMYDDNSMHLAVVAKEDKDVVRIFDSKKWILPTREDKFNLIGNDYWFIINSMEVELNLCGKLSDPGVVLCDFQPYKMIFQKQDEAGKSFFKTDNNLCLTKGHFDQETGGYDVFMQKCGSLASQAFKLLMTNDDDEVDNREGYISPRGIFVPTEEESSEYERIQIEEDPDYEIGAVDGDLYLKNEVEGENPHLINNIHGSPRFWRNGRLYASLAEFIRSNYGNSRPIDVRNLIRARINNKRIAGMDNAYSMIGGSAENNALFGSYADENTSHTGHRKIHVAAGSAADINDTSRNFVGLDSLLGNIYDYDTLKELYTHVNSSKISGNILKGLQERYTHLNSSNINNTQIDLSQEPRKHIESSGHDESHLRSKDGKLAHVNKVGNSAGHINSVIGNENHTSIAQGNFGSDVNLNNGVVDAIHHNNSGYDRNDHGRKHNLDSKTSHSNVQYDSGHRHASHHHSHGSNDDHDSDDHTENYNNSNSNASINDTNKHVHSRGSDQNNHGGSHAEESDDRHYSSTGGHHHSDSNHDHRSKNSSDGSHHESHDHSHNDSGSHSGSHHESHDHSHNDSGSHSGSHHESHDHSHNDSGSHSGSHNESHDHSHNDSGSHSNSHNDSHHSSGGHIDNHNNSHSDSNNHLHNSTGSHNSSHNESYNHSHTNSGSHNSSSGSSHGSSSSHNSSNGSFGHINHANGETNINGSINSNNSLRNVTHGVGKKIPVIFNYTKLCANQPIVLANQNNCIDPKNSTTESPNLNQQNLKLLKSLSNNPVSLATFLSSGGFGSKKTSTSKNSSTNKNLFFNNRNYNTGSNSYNAKISESKRNDTISKGIGIGGHGIGKGGLSNSGVLAGSLNLSAQESAGMSNSGSYSKFVHAGGHQSVAHSKNTTSSKVNRVYR